MILSGRMPGESVVWRAGRADARGAGGALCTGVGAVEENDGGAGMTLRAGADTAGEDARTRVGRCERGWSQLGRMPEVQAGRFAQGQT